MFLSRRVLCPISAHTEKPALHVFNIKDSSDSILITDVNGAVYNQLKPTTQHFLSRGFIDFKNDIEKMNGLLKIPNKIELEITIGTEPFHNYIYKDVKLKDSLKILRNATRKSYQYSRVGKHYELNTINNFHVALMKEFPLNCPNSNFDNIYLHAVLIKQEGI